MHRIGFLVLLFILNGFLVTGQQTDTTSRKPTIFIYNEDDSPYTLDFGGGTGISMLAGHGWLIGAFVNLDVYHILVGYKYNLSESYNRIANHYFILGYRYRTMNYMFALGSGIGLQKVQNSYGYPFWKNENPSETYKSVPIDFQGDFIFTDNMAVGIHYNYIFSEQQNTYSLMIGLKVGILRNVY